VLIVELYQPYLSGNGASDSCVTWGDLNGPKDSGVTWASLM